MDDDRGWSRERAEEYVNVTSSSPYDMAVSDLTLSNASKNAAGSEIHVRRQQIDDRKVVLAGQRTGQSPHMTITRTRRPQRSEPRARGSCS